MAARGKIVEEARLRRSTASVREALVVAAQDLLSQKPIDALTIDEIVQRADVGKGSFYSHFEWNLRADLFGHLAHESPHGFLLICGE